jgi:hypothetical protein
MNRKCMMWGRPALTRWCWWAGLLLALILSSATLMIPRSLAAQSGPTPTSTPAAVYYTVQRGESWSIIADRFGLTVRQLQAANPRLIRYGDVLRVGDLLLIPGADAPPPTPIRDDQFYIVQRGEGWSMIAEKFGVRLRDLLDANPDLVRYNYILYTGDRVRIPGAGEPAAAEDEVTPAPTAAPTAAASPTATATLTPTVRATATATVAPGVEITESVESTSTQMITPTAQSGAPGAAASSDCPSALTGYPARIMALLAASDGDMDALAAFLENCGALPPDGLQVGDWTGDGQDDLVVVLADPTAPPAAPVRQGDLIIFVGGEDGLAESYRARAAGEVTLFALADINGDDQPDVSWVDRTCGANVCFDTVMVISWDGSEWQTWTQEPVSMAFAEIRLEDTTPAGQGDEIVLHGGSYRSEGAGPQRDRSETWGSVNGAPYTLLERTFAESNCLYHTVLDANEAFLRGGAAGFARAEELYTKAATDQTLEACWQREHELEELRSFSLFRLALTAAYQGKPAVATDLIGSLSVSYPGSIYDQVGQVWIEAFDADNEVGAACRAVNQFATENPAAYEILADYGYANPTFAPDDVCPVLDIDRSAISASTTLTTTSGLTTTPTSIIAATPLPTCPADLSGYPAALPLLLKGAANDLLIIETWLRQCDAMTDEHGGFLLIDANGDEIEDAIFWPTIVSDLGFGPDGAQGDFLIYHGAADGDYQVALDEEVYGQPTLLAAEDLNGDHNIDLAWQVVGCSTFCVLEVKIVSWTGDDYGAIIQPGAIIAEGAASFEPVPEGDPGIGQQLVLVGGVSGTPEGGVAVGHQEVWQSVSGAAFQRIRWAYERDEAGNDCLGLRLVEAEVALRAAPVLGYEPAMALYVAAFDPALQACSIYGLTPTEELKLLQGLASFRLIQAEALNGDLAAARQTLTVFSRGQPDSGYAKAATQWLTAFEDSADAAAACQSIQSIFRDNPLLWQITDHFGYNHPALAADQICFVP